MQRYQHLRSRHVCRQGGHPLRRYYLHTLRPGDIQHRKQCGYAVNPTLDQHSPPSTALLHLNCSPTPVTVANATPSRLRIPTKSCYPRVGLQDQHPHTGCHCQSATHCPGHSLPSHSPAAAGCTSCSLGVDYQPQTGKTSCNPVKTCVAGEHVSVQPTTKSNRQCTQCGLGAISTAENVNECTSCDGITAYSDVIDGIECHAIKICAAGEWETSAPTSGKNRECKNSHF